MEAKQSVVAGDEATETNVQGLLARPGLLFAATHGTNVADDPLASYLLCHADNEQDGQLTAAEVLQDKVGAQLVVLSVCYSGLGDRSPLPGDDLFGLQRSLLEAGASNVVAGVWDVYDATGAQLMQLFLQQVKQGQGAPAALALAQREFVKTQRAEGPTNPWIHPYFWVVYKSTGSDLTRMKAGDK